MPTYLFSVVTVYSTTAAAEHFLSREARRVSLHQRINDALDAGQTGPSPNTSEHDLVVLLSSLLGTDVRLTESFLDRDVLAYKPVIDQEALVA